ncbi:MAG TPA: (Fe-S)-binding protein, partial [Acidobacteriota bacterium]|nr:(Fe-S)-binding protein [Acidobacteriota bacterium]
MIRVLLFCLILITAFAWFIRSAVRLVKSLSIGRKEDRFGNVGSRLSNVLSVAFGQTKLLREPLAGLMHFFIFWGFVILLTAVLEAILQGLFPDFTLEVLGPVFPPIAFTQELIGVLVILSCILALARWYLVPPRRYFGPEITGHVRIDATLILSLILLIMFSMFGANATHMLVSGHAPGARFVSVRIAAFFQGGGAAASWYALFWWIHILVVLGFLNYLPYSKHLHVLTSIPNVYFASLQPRGQLDKLNLDDENAEKFGAEDVRDLTWKQLLDGFTCTDCGRCTSVCPANLTGKRLSPRKIIMNIRERTSELAPVILAGDEEEQPEVMSRRLLGNFVTEEELWACTTCRACMEECPVMIEHVPAIMDMRRYLVLT